MKKYTSLTLLFFAIYSLSAQSDCEVEDCACILNKASTAFKEKKYETAIPFFQAYKVCQQDRAAFADSMVLQVFQAIEKEKRAAYANDLVYKSQTALRDGDRTTAFRLAEFAHRYVDDDNPNVTRALCDALYYNDNPNHSPLPWASTLEGHTSAVRSVAFSPDGKRIATASSDSTAKIWDADTGVNTLTLTGHTSYVYSVAFSPDGKRIATASDDKTAKIWDTDTGVNTLTLSGHNESVYSVVFFPDGKRIATASSDGIAKIWEVSPTGCLKVSGRVHRMAGLTLPQLTEYSLENLLDFRPSNEDSLIARHDVWQIAAFAALYEQKTRNSKQLERTARDYARAVRLYRAAANIADDSTFIQKIGMLYQNWAGDILESNQPDSAKNYIELACKLSEDKSKCQRLWEVFSKKTGKSFDFRRFLISDNAEELRDYGDYFYKKGKWSEARQLYEKAEGIKHTAYVQYKLFKISEKIGNPIDFKQFMASGDAKELSEYASFFLESAHKIEKYKDEILDYQSATHLREKQMTLDTSAALRIIVANDYNSLGFYQLFASDGKAAEESILRAIELDPKNILTHTNLAPALMLQGKVKEAEAEYKKWASLPFRLKTYKDAFLSDLDEMEKQGVEGFDYARVRAWLEE
jgi:WD domain, G-beta repeat